MACSKTRFVSAEYRNDHRASSFLFIGVLVVWVIAWFAIMITGSYPQGLFNFVVGVMRWGVRVEAYMLLLTTDRYPPFSLSP